MSARTPYLVTVLKFIEAKYIIYAEDPAEAEREARINVDVARVESVEPFYDYDNEDRYEIL